MLKRAIAHIEQTSGRPYATPAELAEEVFRHCDPAAIALYLIQHPDARGSAVLARVWDKLVELRFGKRLDTGRRKQEAPEPDPEMQMILDVLQYPAGEPH